MQDAEGFAFFLKGRPMDRLATNSSSSRPTSDLGFLGMAHSAKVQFSFDLLREESFDIDLFDE
jgi:hypothetical protein